MRPTAIGGAKQRLVHVNCSKVTRYVAFAPAELQVLDRLVTLAHWLVRCTSIKWLLFSPFPRECCLPKYLVVTIIHVSADSARP